MRTTRTAFPLEEFAIPFIATDSISRQLFPVTRWSDRR